MFNTRCLVQTLIKNNITLAPVVLHFTTSPRQCVQKPIGPITCWQRHFGWNWKRDLMVFSRNWNSGDNDEEKSNNDGLGPTSPWEKCPSTESTGTTSRKMSQNHRCAKLYLGGVVAEVPSNTLCVCDTAFSCRQHWKLGKCCSLSWLRQM